MSKTGTSSRWHTGTSLRRSTSSNLTRTGSAIAFATAAIRSASRLALTPTAAGHDTDP